MVSKFGDIIIMSHNPWAGKDRSDLMKTGRCLDELCPLVPPVHAFTVKACFVMFTVANHPYSFCVTLIESLTSSPEMLICATNFQENAFWTTKVLVSLSPGSTDIYPTCPLNYFSPPPLL